MTRKLVAGLLVLVGAVGAQQATTARPAIIEGRVIDANTGTPLKKTSLTLRPVAGQRTFQTQVQGQVAATPQGQNRQQQSVTTDNQGRFSFTVSQPGDFRIGADRTGYVRTEYGAARPGAAGKTVTVAEGQSVTGIDFRLIPQGVIAGRVVDEDGDPVERAQVTLIARLNGVGGGRSADTTNDLGEFRISGLATGKYYLMAQKMAIVIQPDGLTSAQAQGQTGQEVYAPTYFPGATDPSSASTITVAPGQQVTGIFIPLRKARVYKVSGIISGSIGDEEPPQPARGGVGAGANAPIIRRPQGANRIMINLVERSSPNGPRGMGRGMMSRMLGPDGSFEVQNVPPGSYWATAISQQRGALIVGRTPVEVRNGNVSNLVVAVAPPVTITGIAHGESRDPLILGNAQIRLSPLGDAPASQANGQVQADGSFQIANASRSLFKVVATNLPDGVYLKSVRVSGQDVTKSGLDLSNAPAAMAVDLTFSSKAASIAGTVKLGANSLPGTVLLEPDPFQEGQPASSPIGTMIRVSDAGAFTIKNVPPGNYRLYAFEDVEMAAVDGALLKRLEARSEKLSLSESASANVEMKQISADDSSAE